MTSARTAAAVAIRAVGKRLPLSSTNVKASRITRPSCQETDVLALSTATMHAPIVGCTSSPDPLVSNAL
jgi:hypothetical protein